jgi:hypothetical protein
VIGRVLREPLLHFAVLGAALFVAYGLLRPSSADADTIVVTSGQVASLEAQFVSAWQRPPTDQERRAIIESHVRDEVLYREGLALGLDRDDPVIRSRVKQKVEVLSQDALGVEPTEADLAQYLAAHAEAFAIPPEVTFEQVYFDPARHGATADRDIAAVLAALRGGRGAQGLGDQTLLTARMDNALPSDVAARFGSEFAQGIAALPTGPWQGPVRSTYGLHIVRVIHRGKPVVPTLTDARDLVAREWSRARAVDMREQFYRSLRQRYTVTIEPSAMASTQSEVR